MATKTSQAAKESRIWQDRLRKNKLEEPIYNFESDRRGGRTAWTSKVTVQHRVPGVPWIIPGRYFFDGDNNAREDAAEVAWRKLTNTP
ncbi:double-stranded RNA binding motif domain-containing protein [Aspergillus tubingensis]|uniref:double-stranded RNA binding motif domain-containing protein n=1 Tax=Aspergillus tubingensis TaxID=5068 RepID=UPI001578518B|nr:major facilitator superfamily protein [Aspergillus tubingensis]GFN10833.1 major facilitator superfamily protein [Aspergillus tubingensis]